MPKSLTNSSNEVTQGRIPKEYIPAVDHGFKQALVKGPLAECEVVGVKAILSDGGYHDVDSSEMAFKICGYNCMRETLQKAKMALQEPIMLLEIETPDEYQGPVSGHLSSKRGVIVSSEIRQGTAVHHCRSSLGDDVRLRQRTAFDDPRQRHVQHGIFQVPPSARQPARRHRRPQKSRKRRTPGYGVNNPNDKEHRLYFLIVCALFVETAGGASFPQTIFTGTVPRGSPFPSERNWRNETCLKLG